MWARFTWAEATPSISSIPLASFLPLPEDLLHYNLRRTLTPKCDQNPRFCRALESLDFNRRHQPQFSGMGNWGTASSQDRVFALRSGFCIGTRHSTCTVRHRMAHRPGRTSPPQNPARPLSTDHKFHQTSHHNPPREVPVDPPPYRVMRPVPLTILEISRVLTWDKVRCFGVS